MEIPSKYCYLIGLHRLLCQINHHRIFPFDLTAIHFGTFEFLVAAVPIHFRLCCMMSKLYGWFRRDMVHHCRCILHTSDNFQSLQRLKLLQLAQRTRYMVVFRNRWVAEVVVVVHSMASVAVRSIAIDSVCMVADHNCMVDHKVYKVFRVCYMVHKVSPHTLHNRKRNNQSIRILGTRTKFIDMENIFDIQIKIDIRGKKVELDIPGTDPTGGATTYCGIST